MTDVFLIQDRIYYGYLQAAIRLGKDYDIYRSPTAIDPISPQNFVETQKASFNVAWSYEKANSYGNSVWQTLIDGRVTQVGDYLVNDTDEITFFIIGQQSLLPILSVECNETVSVRRPNTAQGGGFNGYSAFLDGEATLLMQNIPCSFLKNGTGKDSKTLPTDFNQGQFVILMPKLGDVDLQQGDFIYDRNNIRYGIINNELTDFGWRLDVYRFKA